MPGLNRTGPMGNGPMTGGRRGVCNLNQEPGTPTNFGAGFGRGMGFSRGFRDGSGMGMRRGVMENALQTPPAYNKIEPDELNTLKSEAASIKLMLEKINKKIIDLEKTL